MTLDVRESILHIDSTPRTFVGAQLFISRNCIFGKQVTRKYGHLETFVASLCLHGAMRIVTMPYPNYECASASKIVNRTHEFSTLKVYNIQSSEDAKQSVQMQDLVEKMHNKLRILFINSTFRHKFDQSRIKINSLLNTLIIFVYYSCFTLELG